MFRIHEQIWTAICSSSSHIPDPILKTNDTSVLPAAAEPGTIIQEEIIVPQKRDRAWRRFRRKQSIERRKQFAEVKFDGQLSKTRRPYPKDYWGYGSAKNWKLMYIRSNKAIRARQLGFEYPNYIWKQNQELNDFVTSIRP